MRQPARPTAGDRPARALDCPAGEGQQHEPGHEEHEEESLLHAVEATALRERAHRRSGRFLLVLEDDLPGENVTVDVRAIPGLEHLPYAEVWLSAAADEQLAAAAAAARAIGKDALEVWTTTQTPDVAPFLERRGLALVRCYVISELDLAAAPAPSPPRHTIVTVAERPELAGELYALARVAYADQPGRAETRIGEEWFEWGLRAHPPESYFIALAGDRVLGYGYLEHEGDAWGHGFLAVAREARGTGVAGSIKRAQIAWGKANGVRSLRTATETRLGSMLALNARLGYQELYREQVFREPLSPRAG